jgi:hypothetical protein
MLKPSDGFILIGAVFSGDEAKPIGFSSGLHPDVGKALEKVIYPTIAQMLEQVAALVESNNVTEH